MYLILKVKNALVTPVYCVTECTICILFNQVLRVHRHLFHFQRSQLKCVFKLYIPLCRNVSHYTAIKSHFLEAPVFNNLPFNYRFKLPYNLKIFKS